MDARVHEISQLLIDAIRASELRELLVRLERAESSASYWRDLVARMRADESERRESAKKQAEKIGDCARVSDADLRKKIAAYEAARLRRGEHALPHKDEQIARELFARRQRDGR